MYREQGHSSSSQCQRLDHATLAGLATGLAARIGAQHVHATAAQQVDVGLGRLVGPHLPVHGRGHGHGRRGGQTHGAEQIAGQAMRQLSQKIGRSRGDEHEVRPAGQLDVTHSGLGRRIPQVGAHRATGHRLKRHRCHELLGAGAHDDLHLGALVS